MQITSNFTQIYESLLRGRINAVTGHKVCILYKIFYKTVSVQRWNAALRAANDDDKSRSEHIYNTDVSCLVHNETAAGPS